jgi:hypothetical protein
MRLIGALRQSLPAARQATGMLKPQAQPGPEDSVQANERVHRNRMLASDAESASESSA